MSDQSADVLSGDRRWWMRTAGGAVTAAGLDGIRLTPAAEPTWKPRFILSSALYGTFPLVEILPEVARTGSSSIDLWPRPHGSQREEIDSLGEERVRALLAEHGVRVGGLTCYRLGPFRLEKESALAARLGERVILVTGSVGDAKATGATLKAEIERFHDALAPTIAAVERTGSLLAIENHSRALIRTPDSIRWFADLIRSEQVGIALAPHHLPQTGEVTAALARDLGPRLTFVYAQQDGRGAHEKVAKDEELLQMPGRGPLDFGPLMRQLAAMRYAGPIEIFMHPTPRGVPILDTIPEITAEIIRARNHLEGLCRS
jgi:sugar phosphate isomerase/epimerase